MLLRQALGGDAPDHLSIREVAERAIGLCGCQGGTARDRAKGYLESLLTFDRAHPRNRTGELHRGCPTPFGFYAAIIDLHDEYESDFAVESLFELLEELIRHHELASLAEQYCKNIEQAQLPDPRLYMRAVRDYMLELDREHRGLGEADA